MPNRLDRDLNVHGPFTLKSGKLTFRTGNTWLAHDCKRAKETGTVLTVHLLAADPFRDFAGIVGDVAIVSDRLPTRWEMPMVEHSAKLPHRS